MKHLLLLALIAVVALPACAHESLDSSHAPKVSVVGYGEIEAEPDQATLRVSVLAVGKTLAAAKSDADQRYQSVLMALEKAAIPEKQIKVTRLQMQPKYEWSSNKQIYKGEQVSRSLSITINDLDKVGPLMQALVENKVSTVDGLSTGFQDRSGLLKQALAAASSDAKAKAKFLAIQQNRSLGGAIEITEHNSGGPIQQYQDVRMAKSASMSEEYQAPQEMFGTQTITATVNVSYEMK